nr:DNA-directed DNA polymerase [Tanacetum cinerariifolium]
MVEMGKVLQERPQGRHPSNTIPNPQEDIKVITTRSGITLAGPSVPSSRSSSSKEVERDPEMITNQETFDLGVIRKVLVFGRKGPPSLAEALAHMPKYAKIVKDLLTNKEKLLELVNTPLNENCSAVLLKRLPEKLGDTGRFLIPCDFHKLESCMALADLGASINLMPLSVWKKLVLPELTLTRMTLEPFLRMARALVDVHGEELTLQVGDENLVFNVESTSKYPRKYRDESIHKIDILDITCKDHFHEVLNVQKLIHPLSGSPTPSSDPVVVSLSPSLTSFGDNDFILEEIDTFLEYDDSISPDIDDGIFDPEGDIRLIEKLLNNEISNDLPLKELKNDEIKTIKSSIKNPHDLELKDLPPHLEPDARAFSRKRVLLLPRWCMVAIFHDMIEKTIKVFMDDFLVFGDSFSSCLSHLDMILKRCEYTNLVLNWEKCNFMVKEGIVLGHLISKSGIEVDRAKVDVTEKLPPTTVKGIRSFLVLKKKLTEAPILVSPDWDLPFKIMCDASDFAAGAVLGQRKEKYFQPIHYASKTLSDVQTHYTTKKRAISYEFNIEIRDKKGAENLAADHLSRLENSHQGDLVGMEMNDNFPHVSLNMISFNLDDEPLWFAAIANYLVACHILTEIEHKAYWALKWANFDLKTTGDNRKVQLNELNELRDHAYENSLIYKEKTKKIHHAKIKNREIHVGDRVLLFNSRLKIFSGKLKSRWSGPFKIFKVFPCVTVELSQHNGANFKVQRIENNAKTIIFSAASSYGLLENSFGGDWTNQELTHVTDASECENQSEIRGVQIRANDWQ